MTSQLKRTMTRPDLVKLRKRLLHFNGRVRKLLEKLFESRGYKVKLKRVGFKEMVEEKLELLSPFFQDLERFYNVLQDTHSKKLMIQVLAYQDPWLYQS